MSLSSFRDDPGRLDRSHELHARPFPEIAAPATALCIALRPDGHGDPASFDAHLDALLAHYGADRPAPGAKHHYGKIGAHFLKWERHTEFFSYTFFVENPGGDPFDPPRSLFPPEWAKTAPGRVVAATLVHVRHCPEAEDLSGFLAEAVAPHFVPESLAISHVLDQAAIIASDFRIDANGFTRAMVLAQPETGQRRLGRITQRLIEIENYKSMAMLTLPIAQAAAAELTEMDRLLSGIVADYAASDSDHEATLTKLLEVSADIEHLIARNEDRFRAAKAYGAIVGQRIAVLRETRLGGRQTLEEFMLRRFDPVECCVDEPHRSDMVGGVVQLFGASLDPVGEPMVRSEGPDSHPAGCPTGREQLAAMKEADLQPVPAGHAGRANSCRQRDGPTGHHVDGQLGELRHRGSESAHESGCEHQGFRRA